MHDRGTGVAFAELVNLSDLLIIYLTLGAPLAVYKYLQTVGLGRSRRAGAALLTFTFWIPEFVRLGRRYLTNAYSATDLVSRPEISSKVSRLTELENSAARPTSHRRHFRSRDVRASIEGYLGLFTQPQYIHDKVLPAGNAFLAAAGRSDTQLGAICLARRNSEKVKRHQEITRSGFLDLFRTFPRSGPEFARALELGIQIAESVEDDTAVRHLTQLRPAAKAARTAEVLSVAVPSGPAKAD